MTNNRQPWDEVFDRVRTIRSPDIIRPAPVTDTELDCVETKLGLRLPPSYRAFATRYGLEGELMEYLRLYPVMSRHNTGSTILSMTRWIREDIAAEDGAEAYCVLERLRQFVALGSDMGGGWFVFDTTERSSYDPLEYRIYWMPKHHYPVEHRADTFTGFIQWVDTYARELNETIADALDDSELEARRSEHIRWSPYFLRAKVTPPTDDVSLWLSWNNHTARDLALSIRDRGQTDAFPILADALQEAGCTNTDLLDACRTGDPDIDGLWVLRVLLGDK